MAQRHCSTSGHIFTEICIMGLKQNSSGYLVEYTILVQLALLDIFLYPTPVYTRK
ncbi:hypothetical protein ACJIZ3_003125 [Penstemon smallii]|uniref:Uncharacterized protein n=1 Tax=Penstemon smallii TaxID=265156 RepID=A0ABD3UBR7_9LAMI